MDAAGNMPGETGYNRFREAMLAAPRHIGVEEENEEYNQEEFSEEFVEEEELATVGAGKSNVRSVRSQSSSGVSTIDEAVPMVEPHVPPTDPRRTAIHHPRTELVMTRKTQMKWKPCWLFKK